MWRGIGNIIRCKSRKQIQVQRLHLNEYGIETIGNIEKEGQSGNGQHKNREKDTGFVPGGPLL